MRRAAFLLSCLFPLSGHAADARSTCGVAAKTYDSKDVVCTIPHDAQARRSEFVTRFSGGHDDTSASINTSLDGQPLACETGSKKDLFAEDGDVSLYCRFVVDAQPQGASGSEARLQVTIHWSHAEFTDFQLADR